MKIMYIGATPQARVYKQVKALKKNYNLEIDLVCYRYDHTLFLGLFNHTSILKNANPYEEITQLLKEYKPDIIHFFSDKFLMAKPVIDSKIPYVFDPYDFFLEQKGLSPKELLSNWQEIIDNAKAMVLRYDESIQNSAIFKSMYNEKIPFLQLFDYCIDDFFVTRDIEEKKEKSIVHIGYLSSLELPREKFSASQFDSVALAVLEASYGYTIYTSLWSDSFEEIKKDYQPILDQFPSSFRLNPALPQQELNEVICEYQWGSYLHDIHKADDSPYIVCSVGNKVFNYLEASLPILVTDDLTATANFIQKYQIGINVGDINSFKSKLDTIDSNSYEALYNSVLERREEELNIHSHIYKLYNLYKEIL